MKKIIATMAVGLMALGSHAYAKTTVCLITKTDSNPFFVKMKEGRKPKQTSGMTLKAFAGKIEGDNETQVAAIETCILDGAKGILITPSDTKGVVSAVKQARDAGLVVIALIHLLNQ